MRVAAGSVRTACALLVLLAAGSGYLRATETLSLEANETLFCVMAAINAAGYDEGANLPDNSPLRKQLRDYLASQKIEVLPELKQYYRRHMQKNGLQDLSQFTSFAFAVTGPPDFGGRDGTWKSPPTLLRWTVSSP